MNEMAEQMIAIRKLITHENKVGGDLKDKPCPFCGKPRSQRSTYIRCQPCGMNWFPGDALDKHPHAKAIKVEDEPVE